MNRYEERKPQTFRERFFSLFDRNYLARTLAYLLVSLLAVGFIFYIGYHLVDQFEPGLELVDAVTKTVATTVEADAYIFRSETPVYASNCWSGSVTAAVADGGKVSRGGKLADIYAASAPEIENRIAEIDMQIAQLRKHEGEDRSVQSTASLDAGIFDSFYAIASDCAAGKYGNAIARRVGLLVDMQKRAVLRGAVSDYETQIMALENERDRLTAQLGQNLETVYAAQSGYYYAEYDGYGEIFSASLLPSITYDEFLALTESEPDTGDGRLSAGTVLTDYRWYVACPMSKSEAAEFVDLVSCDVEFLSASERFTMTLERIVSQVPGDRAVVILECGVVPSSFDFTRMQKVLISTEEYTGFELPLGALRVVDGQNGVYVQDGVTIRFRRVNILHETDDGTVICVGNPAENAAIREDVRVANLAARDSDVTYDETSFGTYYWIEENDVVVIGGRDLYTGKIIG
ncbi:MAG: hypothetical protein K6A33_04745 [Clostridiales bacterium]|nr:hypothetical protein [Clostridiales bacterium]